MADNQESAASALSTNTRLAYERTVLAHERTLMAWVRTATSLITFGFSVYKFFQLERPGKGAPVQQVFGARDFAIVLIAIGLFSLLLATVQNWLERRDLLKEYPQARRSIATLVAGLMSVLGILALGAVIFRM